MAPLLLEPDRWRGALLAWYAVHGRSLPWRRSDDPYAIWIAEMMLQQTRVATVVPYYERWLARFPTLADLARASLAEVLELWQGLGYYRRAHQLHEAAQIVLERHGGELPRQLAELARLPGVGPYTAAAVAAIAFGQPVAAVDGNQRRVLVRLAALAGDPTLPAMRAEIAQLAATLVQEEPRQVNQALMDLGASVCLPRQPRCGDCPLVGVCLAYRRGLAGTLPASNRRPKPRREGCFAFVLEYRSTYLVARRPPQGLLAGLWEFPLTTAGPNDRPADVLHRAFGLCATQLVADEPFAHLFTHKRLEVRPYRGRLASPERPQGGGYAEYRWVDRQELAALPVSALMARLKRLLGTEMDQPAPAGSSGNERAPAGP